jgi:hypothetical protein
MKLTDLIQSKDGSLSLTKLAAATGHLNVAIAFVWVTYDKGFIAEMWALYLGGVVLHASVDKGMAVINAFKTKQLEPKP